MTDARSVARAAAAKVSGRRHVAQLNASQLKQAAKQLAAKGSHGDSMLIHVNPKEAAALKASGGIGSINPRTGLHQYYDTGGTNDSSMSNDMSTSGGAPGDASGGQGSFGGAGIGPDSGGGFTHDPSIGSEMANNGLASHNAADDAAVAQMDVTPGHVSGVNAASSVMDGLTPSFSDRVGDFFGANTPGGFLGSNAVQNGAGLAASMIGGPALGMAVSTGVGMAQGRGLAGSSSIGGTVQGMMDHGTSGPASDQSQTTATDPVSAIAASPYLGGGIGNLPGFSTTAPVAGATPQGAQWGADLQRKLAMLQGAPTAPY